MSIKRVLVPLDLMRSPADALIFARDMAANAPVCVTLLYVLDLKVGPPAQQVYHELAKESETALRRLARFFFGSETAARVVVRKGPAPEEIAAQAKLDSSDLIILSGPKPGKWRRLLRLGTAQKIIDTAPCPAVVLPRHWKKVSGIDGEPVTPETVPSEVLLPAA